MHALPVRRSFAAYLLIPGLALAFGWGLRGQFGHERGAMLAGVMAAAAIALVSTNPARRNRIASMAIAGAIGFAIGGVMSYGKITGFMEQRETLARGIFLLAAKGAIWGGIGGGVLGMSMSRTPYHWRDAWWLAPLLVFWIATGNIPTGESLSAGDMSKTLGLTLVLLFAWLLIWKSDRAAAMTAACVAVGFGIGFPLGTAICKWGETTGIPLDWWKVAEMTWGLCGGIALGVATFALDEDLHAPKPVKWGAGAYIALLLACCAPVLWNGWNVVKFWTIEHKVMPLGDVRYYQAAGLIAIAGVLLCLLRLRRARDPEQAVTAFVLLFTAFAGIALQFVKFAYPWNISGGSVWTHAAFAVMFLMLALYAFRTVRKSVEV